MLRQEGTGKPESKSLDDDGGTGGAPHLHRLPDGLSCTVRITTARADLRYGQVHIQNVGLSFNGMMEFHARIAQDNLFAAFTSSRRPGSEKTNFIDPLLRSKYALFSGYFCTTW